MLCMCAAPNWQTSFVIIVILMKCNQKQRDSTSKKNTHKERQKKNASNIFFFFSLFSREKKCDAKIKWFEKNARLWANVDENMYTIISVCS